MGMCFNMPIAKSINSMSTLSSMNTAPVLEAFLNIVPSGLADGNIVELGDFDTFRVSVSSKSVDQAKYGTSRSITDVHVLFTLRERFR